jgi:formylglycine-generating enzyme required for sulfatase activity
MCVRKGVSAPPAGSTAKRFRSHAGNRSGKKGHIRRHPRRRWLNHVRNRSTRSFLENPRRLPLNGYVSVCRWIRRIRRDTRRIGPETIAGFLRVSPAADTAGKLTTMANTSCAQFLGVLLISGAVASAPSCSRDDLTRSDAPSFGLRWTVPDLDIVMESIPSGHYERSISADVTRVARQHVHISRPFWLGKYEITRSQFAVFVRNVRYSTTAEEIGSCMVYAGEWRERKGANWRNAAATVAHAPVACVSWRDATRFCDWLTGRERKLGRIPDGYVFRLPTEAEWEYCCRAGCAETSDDGEIDLNAVGWYSVNSGMRIHAVGKKRSNSWGIHDMLGNVREWCLDRCTRKGALEDYAIITDTYTDDVKTDPICVTGGLNIARGGGFADPHGYCTCSHRMTGATDAAQGFRIVLGPNL